jgi:hypothetical protein
MTERLARHMPSVLFGAFKIDSIPAQAKKATNFGNRVLLQRPQLVFLWSARASREDEAAPQQYSASGGS